jgi:hypothetical protein
MATHRSPEPVRPLFVVGFDPDEAHKVIHGLAVAKTAAERSKIDYRYDTLVSFLTLLGRGEAQPVAVTVGDNYDKGLFKHWVEEEEKALWRRFGEASQRAPGEGIRWMHTAWRARQAYYENYQDLIKHANESNAEAGNLLNRAKQAALVSKAAAEIGMAWMGVGAPVAFGFKFEATMTVAWEKVFVSIGTPAVQNVVEHAAEPPSAEEGESQTVPCDVGGFLMHHWPDLLLAREGYGTDVADMIAENAQKIVDGAHPKYGQRRRDRAQRKVDTNKALSKTATNCAKVFAFLSTCNSVYELWRDF